jgi:hypothetical protein
MCFFEGHTRELGSVPEELLAPLDKLLENSRDTFLVENAHKPNKFGDFEKSTQHIVFKFPVSLHDHTHSDYRDIWEKYREAVQPIIEAVTPVYGYKNGKTCRIMLAKLKAHKEIKKHIDGLPASDVPHKIHVPLITHPNIEFQAEDEYIHLPRGAAYEVNNKVEHGGRNTSDIDRIHLIFDYYEAA